MQDDDAGIPIAKDAKQSRLGDESR